MKAKIVKIGDEIGVIVPKGLIKSIGTANSVDIAMTSQGLLIGTNANAKRKPMDVNRDDDTVLLTDLSHELDIEVL